ERLHTVLGVRPGLFSVEQVGKTVAQRLPCSGAKPHQRVEALCTARNSDFLWQSREQSVVRAGVEIENAIADGDANVRAVARTKNSVRQILNRKIGAGIIC